LQNSVDDPKEKEFYGMLTSMEREHRISLENTYEYFKDPEGWFQKNEGHRLDGA
jgi:rubrerythrin